ncbi:MAG: hypothetical protein RI539_07715 [Spiribacter sp.]|jgi:hypothetical protein|nr:hypothetical protein [Spiribacter sp.]MDR9490208.1 hypothetical protein [Spiribacter sp.]
MHAWEGQNFDDVQAIPQRRDPRQFQVGCATHNGRTIVLQWFRNMPEISQWLRRMEPQRWGLKGPALIEIKSQLEPVLTQVDVYGLREASRQTHNATTAEHYTIAWWGDFAAFAAGRDAWSQAFLKAANLKPIQHSDNAQAKALASALRKRVESKL